ncbi:MAG: GNAT family N-acetyltransferase [Tenericutes bacterium]|nr:GNAT family N-acetyltransferase [Mycoplasmatota bacterium]
MFQLYLHDITASLPMDLNEHGLFEYNEIDFYFNGDENHHAFFVKVDGKYAGFVLIDDNFMVLNKEKGNYNFLEMFILNAYKNKGIGKEVAIKIFY